MICIDSCNFYEIPNVFTPNGDDINDRLMAKTTGLVEKLISNSLTEMVCFYSGQKIPKSTGMGPIREKLYLLEYIFINAMFMKTVFQD